MASRTNDPGPGGTPARVEADTPGRRGSSAPVGPARGEARAYRGRLKAWAASLGTSNPIEAYLVERAVALSWDLDQAERAQRVGMARFAVRARGAAGTREPVGRPESGTPDDLETCERLQRYQLDCSRALLRTLEAIGRLRGIAGGITGVSAAATAVIADEPVAEIRPLPGAADAGPSIIADGSARRRPRRPRPSRLGWSVSRVPATKRGAGSDAGKAHPARRERRPAEDAPPAAEPRRRVGGYSVPLDPPVAVSCADRIPVRLRREALRGRPAKATPGPRS